jgi:hypothetical protein
MISPSNCRFSIGPMSKNIVDACIDYANTRNVNMIFIPSRRQIEWDGGYANNWDTRSFAHYVRSRTDNILIERDHGGPGQGNEMDDGMLSLAYDCRYFRAIHIDPFKTTVDFEDGCRQTAQFLEYCYFINPSVICEVGTEQAIFPYSAGELDYLLSYLCSKCSDAFTRVTFAVIQSGTSLSENTNTGEFDRDKLNDMVMVCRKYGLLSKVHNGDYLPIETVKAHFSAGVDCINIAPEFGQIETQTYLDEIRGTDLLDTFYRICYDSGKWIKWVDKNKELTKEALIEVCGHYVLSYPTFLTEIKSKVRPDIDDVIKSNVTKRLEKLYGTIG